MICDSDFPLSLWKYTNVDLKASLVIAFKHYSEKAAFLGAVYMEVGFPG